MAEGLTTADGSPVAGVSEIGSEQDFAATMAGAAKSAGASAEMPAPPKKDYGVKADGSPKRAAGRPRKAEKAEQPRMQAPTGQQAAAPRDYTQPLAELTEGLWFLMAQLPPTQAQAAILKAHRPSLVSGWNVAAQHNGMIRAGVEMLTGGGTWVAAVAMATAPFVMQSMAIWTRSDEQLAESGMPTKAQLETATAQDLAELARAQEEALKAAVEAAA